MFHEYNKINLEMSNRGNWKTTKYLEVEQLTSKYYPRVNEERSKTQ